MQLDVEVSPPANRISLTLTLTHMTFDLQYFLGYEFWLRHIHPSIHPDIQKVMHKSPPCIRKGGLKKLLV